MSRIYSELIGAAIENITGTLPATSKKGLMKFKTDGSFANRPFIDDGTSYSQLMMEPHLPEARRSTKVQLDDGGTGNEIAGTLPYNKGGTGYSSLAGEANKLLRVNGGANGFEFLDPTTIGGGAPFDIVVGTATDVSNGDASYSSLASAIAAAPAGSRLTLLTNTWTENITVNKELYIIGTGFMSVIDGTVTVTANNCIFQRVLFDDDITVNNGVNGTVMTDSWLANAATLTDNNPVNNVNMYMLLRRVI